MYKWKFGDNAVARTNYPCDKCGKLILAKDNFRRGSKGTEARHKRYHESCVGFIASRYLIVDTSNFNERENYWRWYYDQEILRKLAS